MECDWFSICVRPHSTMSGIWVQWKHQYSTNYNGWRNSIPLTTNLLLTAYGIWRLESGTAPERIENKRVLSTYIWHGDSMLFCMKFEHFFYQLFLSHFHSQPFIYQLHVYINRSEFYRFDPCRFSLVRFSLVRCVMV